MVLSHLEVMFPILKRTLNQLIFENILRAPNGVNLNVTKLALRVAVYYSNTLLLFSQTFNIRLNSS